MKKLIAAVTSLILCAALFSGCSSTSESSTENPSTDSDSTAEQAAPQDSAADTDGQAAANSDAPLRVALIYSGFLGDKSFNDLAHEGAMQAVADFGIEVKELESGEASDWESNFVAMAAEGYDVVIGVSTQFLDIMNKHCAQYPDTKFALIDGVCEGDNIVSSVFAQNEGSFLAGAAAAMMTTKTDLPGVNDQKVIGWVGGMDIPVLHDFFVGYEQGAKYIEPDIQILQSFAGTFTDPLKGKELALAQINQGADVVMNVANITGMGVLETANDQGVYAIGVDQNQDDLYPGHILTSMTKNVDTCAYLVIESAVNGTFAPGTVTYMDVSQGGVGLTDMATMKEALGDQFPQDILDKVEELQEKIISGEIVVDAYEGFGRQ